MDEYSPTLDLTFSALSSPTRRQMLDVLVKEPIRVTDLAAKFECSLNVASKHILKLERAGLVCREQKGREHWLVLNAAPLSEASAFVQRYQKFWARQLDQLGAFLDKMAAEEGVTTTKPGKPRNLKLATK